MFRLRLIPRLWVLTKAERNTFSGVCYLMKSTRVNTQCSALAKPDHLWWMLPNNDLRMPSGRWQGLGSREYSPRIKLQTCQISLRRAYFTNSVSLWCACLNCAYQADPPSVALMKQGRWWWQHQCVWQHRRKEAGRMHCQQGFNKLRSCNVRNNNCENIIVSQLSLCDNIVLKLIIR